MDEQNCANFEHGTRDTYAFTKYFYKVLSKVKNLSSKYRGKSKKVKHPEFAWVKFVYSEKSATFCEISTLLLSTVKFGLSEKATKI